MLIVLRVSVTFMNKLTCAITGANGFIGSQITQSFRQHDSRVIEMTRAKTRSNERDHLFFDLSATQSLPDLNDIDVLIHAAYDLKVRDKKSNYEINYQGSMNLLHHAKKCNVKKIIYISSMSAFEDARSMYGQTKLAVESIVEEMGGIIVRPGLVFDENPRGIVGAMNKFVQHFKIVPLIGNGQQIFYPCHVQDLVELLFYLAKSEENYIKPIIAAANHALTLREIIGLLAAQQQKKIYMLPIPYSILLFGMKVAEKLRLNLELRSDSLIGAQYFNPHPDFSATKCLPVNFRKYFLNISDCPD